jgi:hypothetical protein
MTNDEAVSMTKAVMAADDLDERLAQLERDDEIRAAARGAEGETTRGRLTPRGDRIPDRLLRWRRSGCRTGAFLPPSFRSSATVLSCGHRQLADD